MGRFETRQKQKEKALLRKKDIAPVRPESLLTQTTPVEQPIKKDESEKVYDGTFFGIPTGYKYTGQEIDDAIFGHFTGRSKSELVKDQFETYGGPTPAVVEETVTYSEPTLGVRSVIDVVPRVDMTKLTQVPGLGVESTFARDDKGNVTQATKDSIMGALGFRNKEGVSTPFFDDDTYEQRLKMMNTGAATSYVVPIGKDKSADIPLNYAKLLAEKIDVGPTGEGEGFFKGFAGESSLPSPVFNIPFTELNEEAKAMTTVKRRQLARKGEKFTRSGSYQYILDTGFDKNLTKAIFARDLNKYLIKIGVNDSRTRLGIINFETNLSSVLGMGFGDAEKVSARFADNIKFILEAGGYLIGETFGSFLEAVDGPVDFDDSESREKFFTKLAPTMSRIIQRKLAQNNINIPYRVAEQLARRYSGVGARIVAVSADVLIPSAAIKGALKSMGKGARQRFIDFRAKKRKENSELTDEQIFAEFEQKQNTIFDVNVYDNKQVSALPLVKKFAANVAGKTIIPIKRTFNMGNLTNGMQLEEAAKIAETAIKNKRVYGPPNLQPIYKMPEVSVMLANRQRNIREAISLEKRINLDPTSKAVPRLKERLKALELQDRKNVKDIMGVIAKASEPRFLREIKKVDNYMILGATATGQMGQEGGGDPAFFEFMGLMTGLILGGFDNLSEAAAHVLRMTPKVGTKAFIKQHAKLINTFDPQMQEMIYARAAKFAQVQDELIAQGVPIEAVETPLNAIMGLSIFHLAEESSRHLIKESSLRKVDVVAELTKNLEAQKALIPELRKAMQAMDGKDLSESSQKFFKMVKSATEYSEANILQLTDDINIIEKYGAKYYKGILDGDANNNLDVTQIGDMPSVATKMDEALHNVSNFGVKNYSPDDVKGAIGQINVNRDELLDDVATKAIDTITKGDVTKLKSVEEAAEEVAKTIDVTKLRTKEVDGKKIPIKLPNTTNVVNDGVQEASDLFAILLESKHMDEQVAFKVKYNRLNGTLINPKTNQEISGKVTADGGAILDGVFNVLRKSDIDGDNSSSLLIERLNNSTINKGQETKIFQILENAADNFFIARAAQKSPPQSLKDYKEEMINLMNDAVENRQHNLIDGVSQDINLMNFIREAGKKANKNVRIIPFSIDEVRQLRTAFGQLVGKTNNVSAKSKLRQLDKSTDDTFKSGFTVELDDGSKLQLNELGLRATNPRTDKEEVMTVLDYLKMIDDDYFNFKRRFYDKGPISDRMGWRAKRLYVEPSNAQRTAIGLDTTIPTNKWLDLDKVANMGDEVSRLNYGSDIMSALGNRELIDGSFVSVLKPQTKEADTFKAVLQAGYNQWLRRNIFKLKPNELVQKSENISSAFRFIDENGQPIRVFDWRDVIDESYAFNNTNFKEEIILDAADLVTQAIDNVVTTTAGSAKRIKQNVEKVKDVLRNYSATNVTDAQLPDLLLDGGQIRLDAVMDALRQAGRKEDEITEAIYEVIAEGIDNRTFKNIGSYSMDFTNQKIYPDLDMDLDALKKFAGFENPTSARAKVFEKVVGKKRAKFYKNMMEFLELQKVEGQSVYGLKNAARAFSLESYISRFYSIQRGVISARYVGTEAILQQYRLRGASAFRAMLNDPKAGQAFLDIIRSGKQIDPAANRSMFNLLVKFYAFNKDTLETMEQQGIHGNVLNIPSYIARNIQQLKQTPVLARDDFGDFKFPEFLEVPPERKSDSINIQMQNIQRQKQRRRGLPNEAVQ